MSVGVLTVLLKALHVIFFYSWLDREKDEDEGIPSETEDDKRQLETKAKEMRGERKEKNGDTFAPNITKCFPHSPPLPPLSSCLSVSAGQIC